jgi:hypothetical protein
VSFVFREKNKSKIMALGMVYVSLLAPGAQGQAKPEGNISPLPPQVQIRIDAHPKSATIGDPIRLEMDIRMPAGFQAKIPKPVSQAGDFFITNFSSDLIPPQAGKPKEPAKPAPTQAGAFVHHRTQITLAIYKTGKFIFPSIPVKIRTADGNEIDAKSPPVEIEIRSVITEKDPKLKDLKKQAEIPEPVRWILWIILAASLSVLSGIAWYLWRRRRRHPVALTPAQMQDLLDVAETDLRNLLARGLPGSGMEKQFYIALSEIVKRILEAGYSISTAEQTTSEIMDALRNRQSQDSGNRDQIESFLTRCDVVKFAKYVPTRPEHDVASQDALSILAEARRTVASRQSLVGSP